MEKFAMCLEQTNVRPFYFKFPVGSQDFRTWLCGSHDWDSGNPMKFIWNMDRPHEFFCLSCVQDEPMPTSSFWFLVGFIVIMQNNRKTKKYIKSTFMNGVFRWMLCLILLWSLWLRPFLVLQLIVTTLFPKGVLGYFIVWNSELPISVAFMATL
jgi:hypothetical protein